MYISKSYQSFILGRESGFCTSFSYFDGLYLEKKVRGSTQNLHLTPSNTDLFANLTDERNDVTGRDLRNFCEGIQVAILSGQRIALAASLIVSFLLLEGTKRGDDLCCRLGAYSI